MRAKGLLRVVHRRGCIQKAGRGSHVKITCGTCATVIANHAGDIPAGTLRAIIKDLEPCLGPGWEKG